ncbi:MAG: PTS sugar transporter subunit IIC [Gemmatimonadaceae bacterium]|nr:PTS sugar transporter subunit IIC [Gemmatimonadaceae bacterium]
MMDLPLLPLVALGAFLGIDVVSFPQAMISRPIVAATLGGAVVGDVVSGLFAGAVLEMMAMETLPVGASRYPEWGTASVVGGALAAVPGADRSGALVLAVFAAIATGWAGGWSMYLLRRVNGVWARRALPALESGAPRTVIGLQARGLAADIVRAALVTLFALLVWLPVTTWLLPHWSLGATASRAVLVAVAGAVAGSAAWRLASGVGGAPWYFLAGIAAALATVVLP